MYLSPVEKQKSTKQQYQYTLFCININVYTNNVYCINGKPVK